MFGTVLTSRKSVGCGSEVRLQPGTERAGVWDWQRKAVAVPGTSALIGLEVLSWRVPRGTSLTALVADRAESTEPFPSTVINKIKNKLHVEC